MSSEQQSLLHGEHLARHVEILEQLCESKLTTLRSIGEATTAAQKAYEEQLLIDLGLICGELRSLRDADDIPF